MHARTQARIMHTYMPKYKYELEAVVGDNMTVEMNENYDERPWYIGTIIALSVHVRTANAQRPHAH
jgi:hypothetical protein